MSSSCTVVVTVWWDYRTSLLPFLYHHCRAPQNSTSFKDSVQLRTLESLRGDYQRFLASGGNIKNAKFYNNVICPLFFDIPPQVCIPGLHISLGVFYRLYSLLEAACHELDLIFAEETGSLNLGGGASFDVYSRVLKDLYQAKEEVEKQTHLLSVLEQLSTFVALTLPEESPALERQFYDSLHLGCKG